VTDGGGWHFICADDPRAAALRAGQGLPAMIRKMRPWQDSARRNADTRWSTQSSCEPPRVTRDDLPLRLTRDPKRRVPRTLRDCNQRDVFKPICRIDCAGGSYR
jgi:hypothetical protein